MASERIVHERGDPDAWICVCGNTPAGGGFYTCDESGNEVEPTEEAWTTGCYVCAECGRIIDQDSREVVGRNVDWKPLPDELFNPKADATAASELPRQAHR